MSENQDSLIYNILAECKVSKARVGKMVLKHGEVDTPVFMPVGTQVNFKIAIKIVAPIHVLNFRVL